MFSEINMIRSKSNINNIKEEFKTVTKYYLIHASNNRKNKGKTRHLTIYSLSVILNVKGGAFEKMGNRISPKKMLKYVLACGE